MTKKRSSEILADENRKIFREKVTFRKFYTESENLLKIGGKSETRGMHHGLRGMDAPGYLHMYCPILLSVLYRTKSRNTGQSHIPEPPKVRRTSRTPIFSRPSTKSPDKSPLYNFSLNCSQGLCPGCFVWKVFVRYPSVRIHLLID